MWLKTYEKGKFKPDWYRNKIDGPKISRWLPVVSLFSAENFFER